VKSKRCISNSPSSNLLYANPARAAVSYVVLEPFGLRVMRWELPTKLQDEKMHRKMKAQKTRPPGYFRTASLCRFISA